MRRTTVGLVSLALVATLGLAVACDDNGGEDATPTPEAPTATVATEPTLEPTPEPSPQVEGECSAAGLSSDVAEQPELPPPVAEMREGIVLAAVACDFGALEELALAGGEIFSYSFGEPEGRQPARFWREAEQQGEPVLATLVEVLNMPPASQNGSFAWPFAFTLDFSSLTEDDRTMLEQFFTDEEIVDWENFGGYIGYRAIITDDGDWMAFIAGD